jgi:hypothetical protein
VHGVVDRSVWEPSPFVDAGNVEHAVAQTGFLQNKYIRVPQRLLKERTDFNHGGLTLEQVLLLSARILTS